MKDLKKILLLTILSLVTISINTSTEVDELSKLEEDFESYTVNLTPDNLTFLQTGIAVESIPLLMDTLSKSAGVFKALTDAFQSKYTNTFKEKIQGKGFDHFHASGSVKISKGIKADKIGLFSQNLFKIAKVPEKHKEAINAIMEEIEFVQESQWNNFKTAFDIGANGEAKFISIYAYQRESVYDVILLDFQGTFRLAPDTMFVKKELVVLGLWKQERDVFEKKDRSLTQADLDEVMNFFSLLSYKKLAEGIGAPFRFDLPKLS